MIDSRSAKVSRTTNETTIRLYLNIDGMGSYDVNTGIGFFDHMLEGFTRHGGFDLTVACEGDLFVDGHHTVEDVGIVLGQAIKEALQDKRGINRFGSAFVPMDEALASCHIDISGRAFLVYQAEYSQPQLGTMDTALVEEFFRAVAMNAGITLHLACPYGKNDHHKIEALFKAFARALRGAVQIDDVFADQIPSTKGVL